MEKIKVSSTLARAGKVDIRVDEDQSLKLREIIDLLIEAGYFRAKIKGLSPFDKIIGGLTWCIEVCNFDVDVDLLFHDGLSIGQKISLTEQIVKVLPSMKCPYRIEPHQIQGLDAIHIFPVMKWLVTQASERRAEYQDEIRIIALDQFNRQYSESFGNSSNGDGIMEKFIHKLRMKYGPKYRFRRKPGTNNLSDSERVLCTLLEYSEIGPNENILGSSTEIGSIEGESEDLQQTLAQTLMTDKQSNRKLSSKFVNLAIQEQVKGIADATHQFHKSKKEDESTTLLELLHAVEKQKSDLEMELGRRRDLLEIKKEEETQLVGELEEARHKFQEIEKEISDLQLSSDLISKENMEELNRLLEANENIKKRISEFKENCRRDAASLEEQIQNMKIEINEKENEQIDESLLELWESEKERLVKFRTQLAKKSREVELYKRLVDDVPGRAELSQYQRRFVELYNLVGAEHHETLQFYNLYNSLADSKSYMEKELDLLNSIHDNMDKGLKSQSSLAEYICQLDSIIEGIKQNKMKLEQQRSEVRIERGELAQELSRLQDLQLLYAKNIYLFSQEIAKNEIYHKDLEALNC